MATNDITCNLCGGTDFFIEAGHYYCNECQTQSQDVREQVFDVPDEVAVSRPSSSKRIRKEKKPEDQLTSWECYNYIFFGLVNELIELGADPKLKRVVHILWFKYLKKLEVLNDKPNELPKLSAVNSRRDAEIIYGRPRKRRKASRTPSPSSVSDSSTHVSSTDTPLIRKERAKQRRSMILAQYDELSNTMHSEDVSLHNQSLISLKSGSDSSKATGDKYLQYNYKSKKELLKIMSKNHFKTHCRDVNSLLDCHKITRRSLSHKYTHSCEVLSRSKVYALIYLGLLIVQDKIQLGDMLRFIREGHLSYHSVNHFFPEEFENKILSIKSWNSGNNMLCHFQLRRAAADIAKNLKITKYIPRQNLVQLCQRYCEELNLPDEVWGYTLNMMSKATPKMNFTEKSPTIPNYEGRVMSFIIFFLKLSLGLDEMTEVRFSSYAEDINNSRITDTKMFIWKKWAHYITYRKLVLSQHHFPTQHLLNLENVENPSIFVHFLSEQNMKHETDDRLNREAEVLKQLLEKLKNKQPLSRKSPLQYVPSLTPFRDYIKVLLNSTIPEENDYLLHVLNLDFKSDSFNFLTNPILYLEQLNKHGKVGVKHRGVNNNLKIIKIPNPKVDREKWRRVANKTLAVRISKKNIENKQNDTDHLSKTDKLLNKITEKNSKEIIKNFEQRNIMVYKQTLKRLLATHRREKHSQAELMDTQEVQNTSQNNGNSQSETSQKETAFSEQYSFLPRSQCSQTSKEHLNGINPNSSQNSTTDGYVGHLHYNPYDRYWLKSVSNINREEFSDFIEKFPNSFQLLLNECSRITEQSSWELFDEFVDVEIYLSYVAEFVERDKKRDKTVNADLKRFINRAQNKW